MAMTRVQFFEDYIKRGGVTPTAARLEQMFGKMSGADQTLVLGEMKTDLTTVYQNDLAATQSDQSSTNTAANAKIAAINQTITDIGAVT